MLTKQAMSQIWKREIESSNVAYMCPGAKHVCPQSETAMLLLKRLVLKIPFIMSNIL